MESIVPPRRVTPVKAMRQFWVLFGLLLYAAAGPLTGQNTAALSPAEQKIVEARKQIEAYPGKPQPYNALALALTQRARETATTQFYVDADRALATSFQLEPGNLDAQKIRVWSLLGQHEFVAALAAAESLRTKAPDDPMVLATLADANTEIGNYDAAVEAAQALLDRDPGSVPGLTRGAYLRELHGDVEGAGELMAKAYALLPRKEVEDRAWVLSHLAHLRLSAGRLDEAEALLEQALELFPGYHYALSYLGETKSLKGLSAEALALRRRHFDAAPHPENRYLLAKALAAAGHADEASEEYRIFEAEALAESKKADNANHELVSYLIETNRPEAARELAEAESLRRRDVQTLGVLAWACHADGKSEQALEEIEQALAVGIRDARLAYRAGAIAAALGRARLAQKYLRQSLDFNPVSAVAVQARQELKTLAARP